LTSPREQDCNKDGDKEGKERPTEDNTQTGDFKEGEPLEEDESS
jgi:hypothetical protein